MIIEKYLISIVYIIILSLFIIIVITIKKDINQINHHSWSSVGSPRHLQGATEGTTPVLRSANKHPGGAPDETNMDSGTMSGNWKPILMWLVELMVSYGILWFLDDGWW